MSLDFSVDFLTAQQTAVLHAALDRIIPADDYPSGWEAGVGDYFISLFRREPQFVDLYRAGLEALDSEALAANNQRFADLDSAAQDTLLAQIEAGKVKAAWPIDPAAFFTRLVDQAMEGFYADPANGGNKDKVSWRMIGYEV